MAVSSERMAFDDQRLERINAVSRVFSPGAPIDQRDLFAGRMEQIRDVIVALNQKGQHVILYGERGVGKTSLANVFQLIYERSSSSDLACTTINADVTDSFSTLWHKVFREMAHSFGHVKLGFPAGQPREPQVPFHKLEIPDIIAPDDVRFALAQLPTPAIIIIDEIDTIKEREATALLAHTIKTLSDHAIKSKIILVGVADSVEELISEHRSVERSLVQVRMPRMSREELFELLQKALGKVNLEIDDDARNVIAQLSHGLPHYTHLLGLNSAIEAITNNRTNISLADVYAATSKAIEKSASHNQTLASEYAKATRSTPQQNLHAKVLLSCALVDTDELGTFTASDVKEPLGTLAGKRYDLASYQRHLDDFSNDRRGPILKKIGTRGMYRYRFINPMLPPYVVIQGIRNGSLKGDALEQYVLNRSKSDRDQKTRSQTGDCK